MNNRARNLIRAIALLLIAVVTIEFLSAGVLRDQSYSLHLRAKAAEDTESEAGELNIPVNESVDGYDPEKNGYYAYLKLRYQLPQDGYEFEDTYLPVLCYNDCIFVRTDLLIDITGLLCDIRGDEVTFTSQNEAKRLLMNVGKNKYVYGEGYVDSQPFPLRTYSINFDAVPVRIEEFVYVPLNLVLSMFGIPMIISNSGYYIARHEDDALDVLLKLYATADHADGVAGAEYIPNALYEDGSLLLGSLTDYFYGFLTFNSKALKMAIPSLDTNGEGVRYYGEIATDLMSMEPDLARILDDGAKVESPFVFALISILQYNKAVDEIYQKSGLSFETVQKAVDDLKKLKSIEADYNNAGFAFVPEYNYKITYNTWSKWDRTLKIIDLAGIAVDIGLDVFDNFLIYAYRDTAAAVGMKVLLQDEGDGKKLNTGAYLNKEEYQALIKEFKNFVPDQWADEIAGKEKKVKKEKNETAQTIIMQSADEVALNATQALIGMLSVVPAAVKAGLSTIDLVANALKISLVSSSNSLLKAYYGQTLLEDIGKKLYAMEKTKLGSRGTSNANYRDMIALSYLYLRLTTLEYEYIINTLNATEGIKKTLEGRLEELYSMILVLVKACPRGEGESDWGLEDVVVSTPEMRISDARKSLKNGIPEDAVIPLYMKIRGNVVEKTEKEPPVPDAKCDFSMKDDNSGHFDANEEGTFSVYLPLQDQENMASDLKVLEKKEFKLSFSSESVDGTAAIKVQFEPEGDKDLGKIYLSNFSWYKYIGEKIAPKMGWASLETRNKNIGANWVYPVGWDYREGLLSAQIADLDDNGTEDCVLYYFDNDYMYMPGWTASDDRTTVYVKVLTRDSDGTVRETGSRQIVYEDGTGFCDAVGGILEFDGNKYVYFECNTNAYYANVYGTLYTFYSFDGKQLRPDFAVGKTGGGSMEFEYSLISYDENGDLSGAKVVYDGSPWYNVDGTYSKQILCGDRDWKDYHRGSSMLMDSFDPPQAMKLGLSMVTGIDPGEVTLENADNGYAFGNTYISYRDMECFSQAFNYNCNGKRIGNNGGRSETVLVTDRTDLKQHVDDAME